MKSNEFQDLWIRYKQSTIDGSDVEISDAEKEQVAELIKRHPSLLAELTDDQVVDSMLVQMALQKRDDDEFVQGCLRKIEAIQNPPQSEKVALTDQTKLGELVRTKNTTASKYSSRPDRKQTTRAAILIVACAAILLPVIGAIWLLPDDQGESTAEVNGITDGDQSYEQSDNDDLTQDEDQNRSALDMAANELEQRMEQSENDSEERIDSTNPFREVPRVVENKRPDANDLVDDSMPENIVEPEPTFVSVQTDEDTQWIKGPESQRIANGFLTLESGRAELQFDNGSDIELVGPAEIEIKSPDSIYVHRGHILASLPAGQSEFSIQTPSSRLAKPRDAQLELNVDKSGMSEVLLDDGSADLFCWSSRLEQDRISLDARDKNQAIVENIDLNSKTPAICMARGEQGQFEGLVNVDGQSIRSGNAENFSQLVNRAAEGWSNSPDDFMRQWEELVKRMQNSINGSFQMDGLERNIQNMDDFFRLNGGFFNGIPNGSFSGSININGEVHHFDSLEEFMKAQRGFFGPVAPRDRNPRDRNKEKAPKQNNQEEPESKEESKFDGSLDLKGHKIQFTPPTEFRKRR